MFLLDKVQLVCNGSTISFDSMIPTLTTTIINIIKIGVPLLLIFFGMIDLGKAVMAQKEDEIKKGQQTFIKRLIAAVIVFLIIFVVQLVVGLVTGDKEDESIWKCVECFISESEETCPRV